jgi:hypothetical protein
MFKIATVVVLIVFGLCSTVVLSSCAWWNTQDCKEDEVALGLAFVHMRKAGGSHILAIVDAWMHAMHCLPKGKVVGTGGITEGKTTNWDTKNGPAEGPPAVQCPHIDMVHSEFECMNENSMKYIPSFGDARKNYNISFFTTLRHPVGRIVSQSFYSGVAYHVVGAQIASGCNTYFPNITKKNYNSLYFIHSRCSAYGKKNEKNGKIVPPMPKKEVGVCSCVAENHDAGIHFLKTDEQVWFNWFKNSEGFADQYMENYYIKRLYVNSSIIPLPSKSCWLHPHSCKNLSGKKQLKAFIETPYRLCSTGDYGKHKGFDPQKALQHVKKLLLDKFDFLILERLHEEHTMRALRSIFHSDVSGIADAIFRHDRRGVQRNTSDFDTSTSTNVNEMSGGGGNERRHDHLNLDNIGADVMPPSVQKFLYQRNALDIEFYNFAVELFFQKYSL